ncbi:MAG: prolipoprotein diacylglyceryl transferase [Solirubrobacteraceae bacterium]
MTALPSVITIGIDPTIELGPITIAWHGLTIAIGIVIGGIAVALDARRRGLDPERVYAIGMILVIGALLGGRAFYLLEHGQLDDPGAWLSTTGFTFYGGFIAAALGIAYYIRRERLSISYLDAIAAGLPLGLAVGRIGDSCGRSPPRAARVTAGGGTACEDDCARQRAANRHRRCRQSRCRARQIRAGVPAATPARPAGRWY